MWEGCHKKEGFALVFGFMEGIWIDKCKDIGKQPKTQWKERDMKMEWTVLGGNKFPVIGEMQVEMEPAFGRMFVILKILIYKLCTTESVVYKAQ